MCWDEIYRGDRHSKSGGRVLSVGQNKVKRHDKTHLGRVSSSSAASPGDDQSPELVVFAEAAKVGIISNDAGKGSNALLDTLIASGLIF